jgi:acetyl esterase/lipase
MRALGSTMPVDCSKPVWETELHVYPGAPHGYQLFNDSSAARKARRDGDEWLSRVLQRL